MYKIYGSYMCPDCIEARRNFDKYGIKYEYKDITKSLANLKEFLKMRDSYEFYDKAKAKGLVGIPTIVDEEGNLTYYYDRIVTSLGFDVLPRLEDYSSYIEDSKEEIEKSKKMCSLDGTGC